MMRAPTLAVIHAAELRVVQSRLNTLDSLRRARVELRATLARPSTLALIAGAAGLIGFWLARQPRATPSSDGAGVGTRPSSIIVARAFIVRYAMQRLPFLLQHIWAARQARAARSGPDMPIDA